MVCRSNNKAEVTMLVVQAKCQSGTNTTPGFYIASVPTALDAMEIDSNLKALGIDAARVFELSNWKTSAQNVAVAFVPIPAGK